MEAIHLPVIECVRLTIQDTVLIGNIPVSILTTLIGCVITQWSLQSVTMSWNN